jgi:hypothetical protein
MHVNRIPQFLAVEQLQLHCLANSSNCQIRDAIIWLWFFVEILNPYDWGISSYRTSEIEQLLEWLLCQHNTKLAQHANVGLGCAGLLAVWLPTTKSRESTSSQPSTWECNTSLERSCRGLQVWFKHRRDQTLQSGVMSSQSPGTPPGTISRLQPGSPESPGKKWHSGVGAAESHKIYYRE